MVDVLTLRDIENLDNSLDTTPTVEPQPEVELEVEPEVKPEVQVEPSVETIEPTSEVPAEDVGGFKTLTLRDLGIQPTSDEVRIPIQQSQETIPTLTLKDLQVPFGGFTLEAEDRFLNVYDIFDKYNNKPLTKEEIIADPDLMEIVYQSSEARFPESTTYGKVLKSVDYLQGAATGGSALMNRNYRAMDPEKAFEIWQNYMRKFDSAHSVTVANEIAYTLGVDDETKKRLAGGYLLFNQMDNIFTGEGSWPEMFDGIVDYTSSAVWDPTTILSFGIGKALNHSGTKASGAALQKMLTAAYTSAIENGATKKAAAIAVSNAMAKAMPMATVDAALALGQDFGRQMQLIEVGAQDEYSKAEGALTALGSMFFPVVAGGSALFKEARKSPFAKNTILSYQNIDKMIKKHTPEEAWVRLGQALDRNGLFKHLDSQFGLLKVEGKINFLPWEEAKDKAKRLISEPGKRKRDSEAHVAFFRYFWFGDEKNGIKGYAEALHDAGFIPHPRLKEALENQTSTGILAETMNWIPTARMGKIVREFEKNTGYELYEFRGPNGGVAPKKIQSYFISNASIAGETLWISSELSRLMQAGVGNKETLELYKRTQPSDGPEHNQAALSLYKRLITSHLSTTGANLQGFKTLVTINTAADFFAGAIDLSRGSIAKAFGNEEAAVKYYNRAYGEWGGSFRRVADGLSPDIPIEYADAVLSMNPKIAEKLFRDVSGDGGVTDSLEMFNLDAASYKKLLKDAGLLRTAAGKTSEFLWKGADAYTKGVQTLTLARLQDNLTKRFAFGTNLNQGIMKKYGITPEEFFSNPDVEFTMAKPEFRLIMEQAAYRAMRETASVNWSTLPATNVMRKGAKLIETVTNRSAGGYIVPFGSFLNTTIATAGDLTGINYLRYAAAYGRNAIGILGKSKIDPVTEDGADLLAKTIVGWTAISFGVNGLMGMFEGESSDTAVERVKNGLSFKQDVQADGTVRNREYEWPMSLIRASSQAIAHGLIETGTEDISMRELGYRLLNEEGYAQKFVQAIPVDLRKDLGVQIGPGQAMRDLKDFGTELARNWQILLDGDATPFAYNLMGATFSKITSGATRHLDPINTAYGLLEGKEMNPDLRQGNKFFNDAGRYLNQLTGQSEGMERRATPTRGFASSTDVDVGKQLMVRSSKNPNLVEAMFNSAGVNIFTQARWDGPAKVKNYMDGMLAPALQIQAELALIANPDFFESPQADKEKVIGILTTNAKTMVIDQMENGGQVPQSMDIVRKLNSNKKNVQKVLDLLSFEFKSTDTYDQKMEKILEMEDGYQQLLKIKSLVDTYDEWSSTVTNF